MRRRIIAVLAFVALTLTALTLAVSTNANADTKQIECSLSPGFSLTKNVDAMNYANASSWVVTYRGKLVYEFNHAELHDIFGGQSPSSNCGGIIVNPDNFAFVVGWKGDLLVAFGIKRTPDGIRGVNMLRFYPHDESFSEAYGKDNQIFVTYGREHDERARFCWNVNGEQAWWHNENHRDGGPGACAATNWYWGIDPGRGSARVNEVAFQ